MRGGKNGWRLVPRCAKLMLNKTHRLPPAPTAGWAWIVSYETERKKGC